MFQLIIRIMIRKLLIYVKFFGRRKNVFLVPPLVVAVLVVWPTCWWFAVQSSQALLPPLPPEQPLQHLRRNRSLQHYMDHIQILIEPSSSPCATYDVLPVIILVTSAPPRFQHRQAVRETWAKHQPTYFILGLYGNNVDEQLVDNYIEAKQYGDLVVFDFRDHYQNLTLKTALMMQWTLNRCPEAQFMFKTDDDVIVNPWMLKEVLKHNGNAPLIGYSKNNTYLHRDEYNKWYVPRWLHHEDHVTKYLSGTGYLINGDYIERILKKAYHVPLVNLEDVYFTYLVAYRQLGLQLTHDRRLSPVKPWLKLGCVYWGLASAHSFDPEEMITAWSKLEYLAHGYNETKAVCSLYYYFFDVFSDFALNFE